MRIVFLGILALLAGCNSDNDSAYATTAQLPPNESTQIAALRADVSALQSSVAKLQLIGKVHGVASSNIRMQGEFIPESVSAVSFGPCTDMGVLVGRGSSGSTAQPDPLAANIEAFHQCTGYDYSTVLGTGQISTAPRIFWDGPNCTGNPLEWEAGGGGFNTQTLQDGVVFLSPVDGIPLMVVAHQTPQSIQIQSAWVLSNPGCQSDIETQLMYEVTPNNVSITGVPTSLPTVPQLSAP